MITLPIHYATGTSYLLERYDQLEARLDGWRGIVAGNANALPGLLSSACQMAALCHVLKKGEASVDKWCRFALGSGVLAFQSTLAEEGDVIVGDLLGEEVEIQSLGGKNQVSLTDWRICYYLSLILRDEKARLFLTAEPVVRIKGASSVVAHDSYAEVNRALCSLAQRDVRKWEDRFDSLMKTFKETDVCAPFVTLTEIPLLALGEELIHRETKRWHIVLEDALMEHHRFYSADEITACDPYGFIAWGPSAMACLANDRGYGKVVEKGYIPDVFLKPVE